MMILLIRNIFPNTVQVRRTYGKRTVALLPGKRWLADLAMNPFGRVGFQIT